MKAESGVAAMRVIGLAGWSGAGKTTLLGKLIPELVTRGVRVSTIKHAHHNFDVDTPGKDSWVHREAGATEVLVTSANRFALMRELRGVPEPSLGELIGRLAPVDLVLIEGFKRGPHPKLEIWRAANGKPFLHPEDPTIVAVAAEGGVADVPLPVIDLEDTQRIADIVLTEARPFQPERVD
jgi:molybdopterin-guanine dinucleotide biosynthesis protein B